MANHKSSKKRMRSDAAKRLRNRYQKKTARTLVKQLRATTDKAEAEKLYPVVIKKLDKLAKRGLIHKNKASNNKSKLGKFVASLS